MTERARPHERDDYRHFAPITTRWIDNDAYGHVNNIVYYGWFDTLVNEYLIRNGALDVAASDVIGLVVETHCNYFSELAFPQPVVGALRVAHVGTSSIRYELAVFADGAQTASAQGHFVHVYVDRSTHRPAPLPAALKAAVERIRA